MNTAQFDKIEKNVLSQIYQIFSDIFDSAQILDTNKRLIKSQLCLVLIAADAFSRFYQVLTDENYDIDNEKFNSEDRIRDWLDKFVLNSSNEVYKKNKSKIDCNSKIIFDIRNALIHSYGLPRKRNVNFGFPPMEENKWKEFKKFYYKKIGKHIQVIDPYILKQAIFQGFVQQRDVLVNMIENNSQKYIKGILKLNEILKEEGTVFVEYKN